MKYGYFKIINLVMLVLYFFGAIVQYNDPDPLLWIVIYGLAAASCYLWHIDKLHWGIPAGVLLICVLWAITLSPDVLGQVAFGEMFEEFEMKSIQVEKSREMYGLLFIGAWMAVLAFKSFRQEKP